MFPSFGSINNSKVYKGLIQPFCRASVLLFEGILTAKIWDLQYLCRHKLFSFFFFFKGQSAILKAIFLFDFQSCIIFMCLFQHVPPHTACYIPIYINISPLAKNQFCLMIECWYCVELTNNKKLRYSNLEQSKSFNVMFVYFSCSLWVMRVLLKSVGASDPCLPLPECFARKKLLPWMRQSGDLNLNVLSVAQLTYCWVLSVVQQLIILGGRLIISSLLASLLSRSS